VVERFHSITPSLLHFPLDIWKPGGGTPTWKGKGCSSENMNLTPKGDYCGRCLSFIRPLKNTNSNGIGSITSHCSRNDPSRTCRPNSRTREISGNQAWKQKLRWFPQNIRAITEKIKLPKKTHGMVLFWIQLRRTYRDLSSRADPARENWTWSYLYFT